MPPREDARVSDTDLESALKAASPVLIIVLLYDGAIDSLTLAKGKMQERKLGEKAQLVFKAISIIDELRSVLNHGKGGELADNLDGLYDYMRRRLAATNLKNDVEGLDEVVRLLGTLREAWMELAARERQGTISMLSYSTAASARPGSSAVSP